MTQYLNLNQAAVAVIYASIPKEVLKGPKGMHQKYSNHRASSILGDRAPMELTREQWCAIWWVSGKWHQRGKESDQFQMCRKDDQGGYSMGNVRIDTQRSNKSDESWRAKNKAAGAMKRKPFIATNIVTGEEFYCESQMCDKVKQLCLHQSAISICLNGKIKKHKGFTFRYA